MTWFTKVANFRPDLTFATVLQRCHISLKHLKSVSTLSSRVFTRGRGFQNCHKSQHSSSQFFIPTSRNCSLLHLFGTKPIHNSGTYFIGGKQCLCLVRSFHTNQIRAAKIPNHIKGSPGQNKSALIYIVSIFIFMVGGAYAAVPLYKVFCQATGLGGQAFVTGQDAAKIEAMQKVDRQIRVLFNADVASSMRWNFKPQQTEVTILPGETALAFYTATNPTDKPIIGISTYNVLPFDAGQYFNKIQCFCFEEQRLNPKEQVDMPVFFYIDPEFAEDPKLENVDTITLSYTFFEAVDGLTLPLPGYPQPHDPLPAVSAS